MFEHFKTLRMKGLQTKNKIKSSKNLTSQGVLLYQGAPW